MRTSRKALMAALSLVALSACDSSDDPVPVSPPRPEPELGAIRFVHASPDAPNVNIGSGTAVYVSNLAFGEASPLRRAAADDITVQVDGIVPGGEVTVIGPLDVAVAADTAYTIIAAGNVATIAPIVVSGTTNAVAAGSVRATLVHAAPAAPQVDVYITAPGADLTIAAPLGSFAFGESLGPVVVPAGDYQARVTLAGDPATVVYDSGSITLADGSDFVITAIENTGPGVAPISLLAATGDTVLKISDQATPAEVRVIHASPDAPSVDVVVNDDFANPVLSAVPYPAFSNYLELPAGTYNFKVTPAGNPGVIVIDADVTVEAGKQYSVYATDVLASIAPLVTADDDRSVATEARLRVLHLAPGAGLVDIYLTATGADINTLDPTLTNVDFLADTGYLGVAGGAYDVTVTVAGTKTVAIGPATVTLADGDVYTAAARDAAGGGAPFGLVLLDDFN